MLKSLKPSFMVCMVMITLFAFCQVAGQAEEEPVILSQLSPRDGEWWLALCADGQGGFYALTNKTLHRWQTGDVQTTIVSITDGLGLTEIACRGDQIYGYAGADGLYRYDQGEWSLLGVPPWCDTKSGDDAQGPVFLEGGLTLGKDRLFFFSTDFNQELHFLSSYDLVTKQFSVDPHPIFSRRWIAYDEANDRLIGTVSLSPDGDNYLASIDYKTNQIIHINEKPFEGEIRGFDPASRMTFSVSYAGAMLGNNTDNQKVILGTPKKLSLAARLDSQYIVFVSPAYGGQAEKLCLLRYDPDAWQP